jgi:thiamine biosynthesis lipoprotein
MFRARDRFRSMGTDVSVVGEGPRQAIEAAIGAVRARFETEDRRFSRFRADSELTHVNRAAGSWIGVSHSFATLVEQALAHAAATDGIFDPTVLPSMLAIGYDRDFDELLAGARGALRPTEPCGRWGEVGVRTRLGLVRVPLGTGLDLGGIAKGWTVDAAACDALDAGLDWVLVNGGGDLRIAGDAPPLEISVEDPGDPSTGAAIIRMSDGALATSSSTKRAWGPGLHHVIDPRTGEPSRSDVLQATVWSTTCTEAEVMATWALITGRSAIDRIRGAIVTSHGDLITNLEAA